ncbi:hypothetical protein HID58_065787 [Brassica napus]|uniref:RNase H type-1 domain-containing protein n=2 Tax=Brassica napus TaxID=3708 RepID=A0ABQ7ZE66_BRANA|nr:hypothetical protein HID58_065787 [Brassica napus]
MDPAGASVANDIGGEGEKFAVGNIYSVKVITGDEFRGIVMAYDPVPNFVIGFGSQEGSKPRAGHSKNTRMVNASFITELSYLGKTEDPLLTDNCCVNLDSLRAKEALAIRQAEADAERLGVGVTAEAQSIYDALSKTLPVQWEKSDILVMKEVRVRSPYLSDCVFGGTDAANNRVKKVSTVMNCLSHHARSYISLGLLKRSSYVTSKIPPWNQCFYMPSKPCLNPATVVSPLGLSRAHCYSSRSKSGKSKMLTAVSVADKEKEKEKDAFFVVRKGDVIGIYKDLNDCQAQVGSSVFDPPVSVYKGYSLPKDAEDYLSSVGMKNPLYCFGASDLREDMFGSLTPCLFQEPTSSKVKVSEEEDISEMKSKDMKHDMPSASVFDQQLKPSAVTSDETCFIEFDGASKGNPGLSGAAAVLKTEDGSLICKVRQGLGIATNNAAEYHGLILGLKHAIERGYKKIKVKGDSKLICMQIKGKWKVNNEVLSKLHEEAKQLTNECISFEISHVLRNLNSAADEQANLAVRLPGNVERISRMLTKALRILKPRSILGPVYSSSLSPRLTPGAVSRTTAGAAEIDADDAVAYSDPTESPTAMPITMQAHLQPRVVVYDGVCHLCHGGVKWIIKADKYRKIKFCCLQSKAAEPYLTVSGVTKEDVQKRFLFIEGLGSYHQASTAALRVVSYLPLPYSALKAFAIVPTPLRDSVYDYVANNRYNWFGKAEDCLVLKEKELLERFIDRDELIDRC